MKSSLWCFLFIYPIVHVDPKVQLPLPKKNVTKKHPKSHKTGQTALSQVIKYPSSLKYHCY